MANISSDELIITNLNNLSAQLNRYLSIIILLFGTIGNLLNCLTLSHRTLRSNPCACLFLASSISNFITLLSGVAVRLLSGWSLDLTNTIGWLCKFRIFVLFASRTVAPWLITLATIDRWFSSSTDVHCRQKSSLNNAKKGILIIVCLSILSYIQTLYCYKANLINSPVKCYGKTYGCRLLIDLEFTFITVFFPSFLMFIFGLLTIKNIRQSALRRIQPIVSSVGNQTEGPSRRPKRTEHSLTIMLFVQVILLTLFALPQAIQNLYSNITLDEKRTSLTITINNFIFNLFFLLTYVTNGMPFYIYTLFGGVVFRKALLDSIKGLYLRNI